MGAFTGQVVLVTGAAGGIGSAICHRFAAAGARVVVHYGRSEAAAEKLCSALAGDDHLVHGANLRDPEAVRQLVDGAVEQCGRLDVLVNNAGVFVPHPPLEVSYETWQQQWYLTLVTNLLAAANAAYCAAHHMARQGGGRIINISSRGAFRGEPQSPAYAASKAGLNALGQSLAQALAPHNIHVYQVAPGFTETPMVREHLQGGQGEAIRQQSPLGRVAQPDEVAYWVTCLAAPEAAFATGAIIDVNGASYLR